MKWDRHGLQLADVPGAGVSRVDPNARSGNPRHDVRSGKFGGGGGPRRGNPPPANVDAEAYKRMLDAVRDAARQLGTIDEKAVAEFIQDRANSPEQVDIANFLLMVKEQRKADLLDIINTALRETDPGEEIHITAGEGVLREHMTALGADEVADIMTRLEGMGHDRKEVDAFFDTRIKVVEEATKTRQKR